MDDETKNETDLEAKVVKAEKKPTFGGNFVDGLKGIPPILACTAVAYAIDLIVELALPESSTTSYMLANCAGLYGGFTLNSNRKLASLFVLTASCIPEAVMFVQNEDIKKAGFAAGFKVAGYGIGFAVTYILRHYKHFSGKINKEL